MSLKRKRNPYDAQLKVIKFAEENKNSAADRHFAVSEKLVRDWRKQKKYLFEMPRTKRAKHYISPYIKLETALNDWVMEYRHNGYIITKMMIRYKLSSLLDSNTRFHGECVVKIEDVTAMVITMMILLLHVRFRITSGSAFSQMMTTIQILTDFKPIL